MMGYYAGSPQRSVYQRVEKPAKSGVWVGAICRVVFGRFFSLGGNEVTCLCKQYCCSAYETDVFS